MNLNHLAELYTILGQDAQAETFAKRALAIREKTFGPEHIEVAISLMTLAQVYYVQGQYARAEPLYKRNIAIREKVQDPNHTDLIISLENLADFIPHYKKG